MKTVNTKITKEVWVTNDEDNDVQFKLRRFPLSLSLFAPNDSEGIVKLAWQRFDYCITSWKGMIDENGKELECTTDNKRLVFDFYEDVMLWVAAQIHKLETPIKKKLKKQKT